MWILYVGVVGKRDIRVLEKLWLVPHLGSRGRSPDVGEVSGDRPNTDNNATTSIVRHRIANDRRMVVRMSCT